MAKARYRIRLKSDAAGDPGGHAPSPRLPCRLNIATMVVPPTIGRLQALAHYEDVPPGDRGAGVVPFPAPSRADETVTFDRRELFEILRLYGRMVADAEWRDYAIDHMRDRAVFSVFRRSSEAPLYRIEKTPKLANRQGLYSVVAQGGMILKRGQDLSRVLAVLEKKPRLVDG